MPPLSRAVALTKGGLVAATRSLAVGYARTGICVNAVSSSVIRTSDGPVAYEGLRGLHPIGCIGQIGDVVDAVLSLESAQFVTGEVLHVDGGQVAGR